MYVYIHVHMCVRVYVCVHTCIYILCVYIYICHIYIKSFIAFFSLRNWLLHCADLATLKSDGRLADWRARKEL